MFVLSYLFLILYLLAFYFTLLPTAQRLSEISALEVPLFSCFVHSRRPGDSAGEYVYENAERVSYSWFLPKM